MKNPRHYFIRMLLLSFAILITIGVLFTDLSNFFLENPTLNGFILGVLILGILFVFRQTYQLMREVAWLDVYRSEKFQDTSKGKEPHLLAPIAGLLEDRKIKGTFSPLTQRSLLEGLSSRLDETRDLTRYTVGLLIFLGLLGTFWGLLQTIDSIGGVISGLSTGGGDFSVIFQDLKKGLEAPLKGMGTAFSSSLFGLAGSLILGFIELQYGQAQNSFYNEVEEWLASKTNFSSGAVFPGDGESAVPAYVEALLEQTADGLENLQRTIQRGEQIRTSSYEVFADLTKELKLLSDQKQAEQVILASINDVQKEQKLLLERFTDTLPTTLNFDGQMKNNLKNVESLLWGLQEEMKVGRSEIISELRNELRILSRTIAATAARNNT